ncbi:hypothetical protein B296_00020643 [Ensete ventricosum]|uniref:Uncharacterized protein n=1 Tax=Ensete ventricosum TaxID=4639 RepID=A0A427AX09_ENSVE|nr:hypothetical protein B296_00020643 [Ensete ventricosum]
MLCCLFIPLLNLFVKDRYANEPSIQKFTKIAALLPRKTIRDVALRCQWMINKENGKRRKVEENYATKKVKDMKLIVSVLNAEILRLLDENDGCLRVIARNLNGGMVYRYADDATREGRRKKREKRRENLEFRRLSPSTISIQCHPPSLDVAYEKTLPPPLLLVASNKKTTFFSLSEVTRRRGGDVAGAMSSTTDRCTDMAAWEHSTGPGGLTSYAHTFSPETIKMIKVPQQYNPCVLH